MHSTDTITPGRNLQWRNLDGSTTPCPDAPNFQGDQKVRPCNENVACAPPPPPPPACVPTDCEGTFGEWSACNSQGFQTRPWNQAAARTCCSSGPNRGCGSCDVSATATDPEFATRKECIIPPVDCEGSWGPADTTCAITSSCRNDPNQASPAALEMQIFTVTTPPAGAGAPCVVDLPAAARTFPAFTTHP